MENHSKTICQLTQIENYGNPAMSTPAMGKMSTPTSVTHGQSLKAKELIDLLVDRSINNGKPTPENGKHIKMSRFPKTAGELVLSFHQVGSRIKLRLSHSAASTFTCWAASAAPKMCYRKKWAQARRWLLQHSAYDSDSVRLKATAQEWRGEHRHSNYL